MQQHSGHDQTTPPVIVLYVTHSFHFNTSMNGENRSLVTDEPVEFEKELAKV